MQVDGQPVMLVTTLLCAVLGGLLASFSWTVPSWQRALLVLLSAVIGTGVAFFLLTSARQGTRHRPSTTAQTDATELTPLSNRSTPRAWWNDTPSAAPSNRHEPPADSRPPTGPLSSYAEPESLIAQCPRCGELRLDVSEQREAYAFRCRNSSCRNTWTWTPDTPWPPVVVRRNLTGSPAPDRMDTEQG